MPAAILALILLTLSPSLAAQTVRYVTDSLRLEARSGPSTQNKIVALLPTGTRVTVIEESDGYSRIRLPEGEEAWMLTRFLMPEPAARDRLADGLVELERVRNENLRLNDELAELRAGFADTNTLKTTLEQANEQLRRELAELKRTAAATLAIQEKNGVLTESLRRLEVNVEALTKENTLLAEGKEHEWFIAGAWVLIGGMVLGIVIPKIRWQKRRSWGEL